MNKTKRYAVLSAVAIAAGGVLATTTAAAAPAQAAPSASERAIDGFHNAAASLVGNVHIKVSNYTDDPIQVITDRNEPVKTLKPGESMYDEDGYSASYIQFNDLNVKTKKGTFKVHAYNGYIGYPGISVTNMPGKVGEKFSGGMGVYERWHHTHDDVTYAFWRNPDGSAKMYNTKNFHVIVD